MRVAGLAYISIFGLVNAAAVQRRDDDSVPCDVDSSDADATCRTAFVSCTPLAWLHDYSLIYYGGSQAVGHFMSGVKGATCIDGACELECLGVSAYFSMTNLVCAWSLKVTNCSRPGLETASTAKRRTTSIFVRITGLPRPTLNRAVSAMVIPLSWPILANAVARKDRSWQTTAMVKPHASYNLL